jgi:hypothetical protein
MNKQNLQVTNKNETKPRNIQVKDGAKKKPLTNKKTSIKSVKKCDNDSDDSNAIDINDIDDLEVITQNKNNLQQIEWRKIPEYEKYFASNTGLVKNSTTNKLLSKNRIINSYKCATLYYKSDDGKLKPKTISIHRIVALTFIPNDDPTKTVVNHIDSNRLNNHVFNLEWVTIGENVRHGFTHGNHRATKRSVQKCDEKFNVIEEFESITDAGNKMGISASWISSVCKGKRQHAGGFRWKFTNENPNEMHNKEIDLSDFVKIKGFPNYMISKKGSIYNLRFKKYMKASPNAEGYKYIRLLNNKVKKYYYVHRLVADHFIKKIPGKNLVNHIDSNRSNNCVDNLEWCTNSENMLHAAKAKREKQKVLNNKITVENDKNSDVKDVKNSDEENEVNNNVCFKRAVQKLDDEYNVLEEFKSIKEATKKTGINGTNIMQVCKGRRQYAGIFRWKYTNENPNECHNKEINLSKYIKINDYSDYLISKKAMVYSIRSKKFLKTITGQYCDVRIELCNDNGKKKFYLCNLVAEYFLPKVKNKNLIYHIDGDKSNNQVYNLEWCSAAEKNKVNKVKRKIVNTTDDVIESIDDINDNDIQDDVPKIIVRNKKKVTKPFKKDTIVTVRKTK